MGKPKSLFDKEIEKSEFKKRYWKEREEFKLELQFLNALEESGLTDDQFAKKIGTSRGNISRDLKGKGLNRATISRLQKMASAIGMDLLPILLPKDRVKRKKKLNELLKAVT